MISSRRAPVRPRVILSETREAVLLEDLGDSLDGQGRHGPVELLGGPRTGKTTAVPLAGACCSSHVQSLVQ